MSSSSWAPTLSFIWRNNQLKALNSDGKAKQHAAKGLTYEFGEAETAHSEAYCNRKDGDMRECSIALVLSKASE